MMVMVRPVLRLCCLFLAVAWRYWFYNKFPFPFGHVLETAEDFYRFTQGLDGHSFSGKDYREAEANGCAGR